ncbi:hypothetical protein EJ06DRAFT_527437 [Trichodelitschia bisporula]|uniref:Uncharacterized protein n=1 Tax=Trichodelitschia bisporula TaxID=703511 RepID=A0A6G1I6L8_9PEZI|nr:hypothetical protein EJ06DRAFT_527437 [Trichodelitschia bisporula]
MSWLISIINISQIRCSEPVAFGWLDGRLLGVAPAGAKLRYVLSANLTRMCGLCLSRR